MGTTANIFFPLHSLLLNATLLVSILAQHSSIVSQLHQNLYHWEGRSAPSQESDVEYVRICLFEPGWTSNAKCSHSYSGPHIHWSTDWVSSRLKTRWPIKWLRQEITTPSRNHLRPAIHVNIIGPTGVDAKHVHPQLMHIKNFANGYTRFCWKSNVSVATCVGNLFC